jgi:hypothetical protein
MDWTEKERLQRSFETTIREFQETDPVLSLQKIFNLFIDNIKTKRTNFDIIETNKTDFEITEIDRTNFKIIKKVSILPKSPSNVLVDIGQ